MRPITKFLVIAGVTAAAGTPVANAADVYVSIGVPGLVFAAPGVAYSPPVYVSIARRQNSVAATLCTRSRTSQAPGN